MNERNIEALQQVLVEAFLSLHVETGNTVHPRAMAEALAEKGVLGPATQVLIPPDSDSLTSDGDMLELPIEEVAERIERIAKGGI